MFNIVGSNRFGDITVKYRSLYEYFCEALPRWATEFLVRIRSDRDLADLRSKIEVSGKGTAACVVASRAGFVNADLLTQLIEQLPYAETDFTDRLYQPLLVFFRDAHSLVDRWPDFIASPIHNWDLAWRENRCFQPLVPLDLGEIREFLYFSSCFAATRHFNELQNDMYHFTKRSRDKRKMQAEYTFYSLVPERMRPWLIETFDFQDEGEQASYKMMKYYLANAALQWVHGSFDSIAFTSFIDRLLFFVADRPVRLTDRQEAAAITRDLFVEKPKKRIFEFLSMNEGRRIYRFAKRTTLEMDLRILLERYLDLYKSREEYFSYSEAVIGHGDLCFSNILYDKQRYLLKLIDPKGALSEEALWTHPIYDFCKISHSVLGDYDFINYGLYKVESAKNNDFILKFPHTNHEVLKSIFLSRIREMGYDIRIIRLAEASLFLSMLPLHIDFPGKVVAFILKARQILDELEFGYQV
ncbi:MAG: hypothetical protein KDD35_01220 [Bdellovibrionales bacterium]|nr:hypothetical protein [Bdellovibrionales bacterium]